MRPEWNMNIRTWTKTREVISHWKSISNMSVSMNSVSVSRSNTTSKRSSISLIKTDLDF